MYRAGLLLTKLLDESDALLQLRLPLLELLHLRDDRVELRRLALRGDDVGVELRRLLSRSSSTASR